MPGAGRNRDTTYPDLLPITTHFPLYTSHSTRERRLTGHPLTPGWLAIAMSLIYRYIARVSQGEWRVSKKVQKTVGNCKIIAEKGSRGQGFGFERASFPGESTIRQRVP